MPRPRLFQDARLLTSVRASDEMIVRNRFESRVTCYNELKMKWIVFGTLRTIERSV